MTAPAPPPPRSAARRGATCREHPSARAALGRSAVHWSDTRTGDGWEIRHSTATDATVYPVEQAPRLYVSTNGGLSLAGAEALALTLLAAYEEAAD